MPKKRINQLRLYRYKLYYYLTFGNARLIFDIKFLIIMNFYKSKKFLIILFSYVFLIIVFVLWHNAKANTIKEDSYEYGYNKGKEKGYEKGYEEGYADGVREGQNSGYHQGYRAAKRNTYKCGSCNGRGVNACFFCDGSGCFNCSNTGVNACPSCKGRGYIQY